MFRNNWLNTFIKLLLRSAHHLKKYFSAELEAKLLKNK